MKKTMIILGVVIGSILLLPVAHWAVWALVPPLSPHELAKTGHFVSVDGIDTYYERYGSGPPLILIPAGGSHTSTWRFNVSALSRSHEIWILDLPGSGCSEKPATFPYTHRSYAEFLRDFMTQTGIAKAAIAGHSLGGAVALEFSLDFPERTAELILIASGGYPREEMPGALNLLLHRPLAPPVQRGMNAILMSFGAYPFVVKRFYSFFYHDPTPFARDAKLIQETCDINRTPNAWDAMYWMQRALNFDFAIPDVTRIKSVNVPTLIIWGREDRIVNVQTAERFHQEIPRSQLAVIDGAGHMVHEEKPDAVNNAITSFLDIVHW